MAHVQLLGIAGSLRAASFSSVILESLQEALPAGVGLSVHPLRDVPLYNKGLDTDVAPPEAKRHANGQINGPCPQGAVSFVCFQQGVSAICRAD